MINLYYQHDFNFTDKLDDLIIRGQTVKAGIFTSTSLGEDFYLHQKEKIFVSASIFRNRLSEFVLDPMSNTLVKNPQRKADWDDVMGELFQEPFATYHLNGRKIGFPAYFLKRGSTYNDDASLRWWQYFARGLVKSIPDAGNNVMKARFHLAPKSGSAQVFFTPPNTGAVFGVTTDFLLKVINENQGMYVGWKMTALTYEDAQKKNLMHVGTNPIQLYLTWMRPNEYAKLWVDWNNTSSLPLPFPKDNPDTHELFTKLATGMKLGKLPVDGANITLTTNKMQNAFGKRRLLGTKSKIVMGKSATDVFRFP